MVTAYIGLGSNLGNCRENIRKAWKRLGEVEGVMLQQLSSPYRSAPVGMESSNWFINAAGSLRTSLPPAELLAELLAVEAGLGRQRGPHGEPADRTVDLDLLYWNDRVCHEPGLILPHPDIADRLFVLLPLAEIGPDVRHPVLHKTSVEMLRDFMGKQVDGVPDSQVMKTTWSTEESEVSE